MFTFPGHFSSRPDICVIPITNLPEIVQSDISNIASGKNNKFLEKNSIFLYRTIIKTGSIFR